MIGMLLLGSIRPTLPSQLCLLFFFFSKPTFRFHYLKYTRKKKGRDIYPIANSGGPKRSEDMM